jgi:hypothetical protein
MHCFPEYLCPLMPFGFVRQAPTGHPKNTTDRKTKKNALPQKECLKSINISLPSQVLTCSGS